jgi:mycofactocin precursor
MTMNPTEDTNTETMTAEMEETRDEEQLANEPEVLDEVLIEEVGIDGMCGVY